jgi:hypothetical protein
MVNDQLAAAREEVGERLLAVRPVEDVRLLDLDPGQRPALPAQLVAEAGVLLLFLEELPASRDPFFARNHGMIGHLILLQPRVERRNEAAASAR